MTITEKTRSICVMCKSTYDDRALTFEQRIIRDSDFCPNCFREMMIASYDSDMDYLDKR